MTRKKHSILKIARSMLYAESEKILSAYYNSLMQNPTMPDMYLDFLNSGIKINLSKLHHNIIENLAKKCKKESEKL